MTKKSTDRILLIGIPDQSADIRYITGFSALDQVVFLKNSERKVLVVPSLELGRARKEVHPGIEVITIQDLKIRGKNRRDIAVWARKLLQREGITRISVPPVFPIHAVRILEKSKIQVNVLRESPFPGRIVKTAEELAHIRESQQAAVIAMRYAIRRIEAADIHADGTLREGRRPLTSEMVRTSIEMALLERNCTAPGGTIVACGEDAVDPHKAGSGPLFAHQAIVMDIFPRNRTHGYWGDLTRTVVKGEPSKALLRMYRAVCAAQHIALKHVRPRVHAHTIHRLVQDEFQKRNYRTELRNGQPGGFIHGTGHGVGLDIHEAPAVTDKGGILRKNQVVTIEPGLYYPGIGGIRIEDTIQITSNGWRYLCPCEKKFVL